MSAYQQYLRQNIDTIDTRLYLFKLISISSPCGRQEKTCKRVKSEIVQKCKYQNTKKQLWKKEKCV